MEKIDLKNARNLIEKALDEDLGDNYSQGNMAGDITSNLTIPDSRSIKFQIRNREAMILCGAPIAVMVFEEVAKRFGKKLTIRKKFSDGENLPKNSVIIEGQGNAKVIFAAERVALNILQHLSGIATEVKKYVVQVAGKAEILDTRKTIPGLRILQKYAVKIGGGKNHRLNLNDGILIKDNHIAAAGGISQAVKLVRKNLSDNKKIPKGIAKAIEIECDNLSQVKECLQNNVDIIMFDNMSLTQIKQGVKLVSGKAKIEVSGGVNLKNVKAISKTGVDYISIGALTHSVKAADIGLDIID